jgi:hypothetical protein
MLAMLGWIVIIMACMPLYLTLRLLFWLLFKSTPGETDPRKI